MKIEKINDNQIKCTLTKNDLASREIQLSELAYGTDKAKELFSDMMQQAANEVGFVVEDTPLMIEAIPVSSECLILLVSKVDDPEELDTRFSTFSPYGEDDEEELLDDVSEPETFTNVLDIFEHFKDKIPELAKATSELFESASAEIMAATKEAEKSVGKHGEEPQTLDITQVFCFDNIDTICEAGKILADTFHGSNALYKLPDNPKYYLVIHSNKDPIETFNHVCNILSEYATNVRTSNTDEAFYIEHGKVICGEDALNKLKDL